MNSCCFLFLTLFLLSKLSFSKAANCTYSIDRQDMKYTCDLKNANILLRDTQLEIHGIHLEGFSDDEVQVVRVTDSIMHFLQPTFFEKFNNLEEFSIVSSELQEIAQDALDSCAHLEVFTIFDAELSSLPSKLFQKCQKLIELNLIDCQLTILPNNAFDGVAERIEVLSLAGNRLTSLSSSTLSGLIRLRELNLAANEIKSVGESAFNGLSEVESLLMYDNKIDSSLPGGVFRSLMNLKELDLRHNDIAEVNPKWFKQLTVLEVIDLTDNEISELPEETFGSLVNLKSIFLDRNKIRRLFSASFGHHNHTQVFTIDHNNLYSIQPNFFKRFPSLIYFHASDNECIDGFLFSENSPIDFDEKEVKDVLHDCFYYHNPPKGFFDSKYLLLLWSGLGVAIGICVIMYALHFYFVRGMKKEMEVEIESVA